MARTILISVYAVLSMKVLPSYFFRHFNIVDFNLSFKMSFKITITRFIDYKIHYITIC